MQTEREMREASVPTFDTIEQLQTYIAELADRQHDYGTCCYALSMAATATFNFMARKLGVTGFQASCADLDILRRTRRLDGPFLIVKAEDELYPQYDNHRTLSKCQSEWQEWISKEAKKRLEESGKMAHKDVVAHWKKLAGVEVVE